MAGESVYGLDIETDTSVDGLDPRVARIVAVAVSSDAADVVLDGPDESQLLSELAGLLHNLPVGVLVTWNGATFDLPFLDHRANRHGIELGLRLAIDHGARNTFPDDPYYRGTFRASWHHHRHLDAYRLYRNDVGRTFRLSCGLKSLARLVGLDPVSVDAARIHDLDAEELRTYVASDARCARQLALRRWSTASRAIDPEVPPTAAPVRSRPSRPLGPAPLAPTLGALR